MAIDPTQIALTLEQRKRLALLAEQTGKEWTELVDDLLDAAPLAMHSQPAGVTQPDRDALCEKPLYDVLSDRGILGCFDGPTDLSTNPKHMEGFGESRFPKNPHRHRPAGRSLLDRRDACYEACRDQARGLPDSLFTCLPVITEASYLLNRHDSRLVHHLLAGCRDGVYTLLPLDRSDIEGIDCLTCKYQDLCLLA